MVISYDQPESTDEGFAKLTELADTVRGLFTDRPDVAVYIAVRETADEVLDIFKAD